MKNEDNISIQMLGEFAIRNAYYKFPQETKKSMQVILLIVYLILHRGTLTSKVKLMELLWPNQCADNPEGALRNLVYRARQEMKKFYPGENVDCILSKNNSYIWNSELECELDIAMLEDVINDIIAQQDIDQQLALCHTMLDTYPGEFMFEFPYEEWITRQRAFFNDLKIDCVDKVCQTLYELQRYQDIIDLCDKVDYQEFTNHKIHELKLVAYDRLDMPAVAMSYYHKIIDMYYSKLGIKISTKMEEIYQVILEKATKNPVNVDDLEREMCEDHTGDGTYYCDFDVFKNIYRINARAAKRSTRARYLILMTLTDESGQLAQRRMEEESELLRAIIYQDLRKNDIFSKCNTAQYAIIVSTPKLEGAQKAIDRILKKYEAKRKDVCVSVGYDIKSIH